MFHRLHVLVARQVQWLNRVHTYSRAAITLRTISYSLHSLGTLVTHVPVHYTHDLCKLLGSGSQYIFTGRFSSSRTIANINGIRVAAQ